MNFYNFFTIKDYEYIKHNIDNKREFEIKRRFKKLEIEFKGRKVSKGGGYATEDFSKFKTFQSFISLVDDFMGKSAGYIKDNQLNLF